MKSLAFHSATRAVLVAFLMTACGGEAELEEVAPGEGEDLASVEQSLHGDIAFKELQIPAGHSTQKETRRVFTNAGSYQAFFGVHAPANVDFRYEWVFFYSAGVKSSGGYAAKVQRIAHTATTLHFVTSLESPGPDCFTTMALTTPQVMVKFKKPAAKVYFAAYYRSDKVVNCEETPSVFCGGIAAIQCPGVGSCLDDPSDSCDPDAGGADCGGACACLASPTCAAGFSFDSSADVCACVPTVCLNNTCGAGTKCIDNGGEPLCVSDGTLACGANTCGDGLVCCNASCGICTPPDFACIQIACE